MKLYQQLATRTMRRFDNYETNALYFSGALCGEAGEAFELVKKHIRDLTPLDKHKLTKELGDVLWYVAAVCELHGITLEEVAATNIRKLEARYPSHEYRASDAANERE